MGPQDQTIKTEGPDFSGDTQFGNAPEAPKGPDPARVDAFKKNLAYLWQESLELTGLPVDTILGQVFVNASQKALPAKGTMMNYGAGPNFMPDPEVMASWIDAYFDSIIPKLNSMAEE